MTKLTASFAAAFAALTVAAPGCGQPAADAADAVTDTIQAALTSTDPADCTRLFTQRFLKQNKSAGEPVEACRRDAADAADNPDSMTVTNVDIEDGTAHADVALRGGELDGQALRLRLVRSDAQWRVDRYEAFLRFDRGRLLRSLQTGFTSGPRPLSEDQAACVVRGIARRSDQQLERLVLNANSPAGMNFVLDATAACHRADR